MPNPKVCAICGYAKATTRDHVPPKGIFPRPLPVKMITVPACSACNNGANNQDERFRVYLAAMTAHFNDEATRAWHEGAMRTMQGNKRLMREFAAAMGPTVRVEVSPGNFEERIAIRMPVDAYAPVVERIVRGLYYHHFGRALGKRAKCQVDMLYAVPDAFYALTNRWKAGDVGGQIFVYRYAEIDATEKGEPLGDDNVRSFWVLQFFDNHWATVETYPVDGKQVH